MRTATTKDEFALVLPATLLAIDPSLVIAQFLRALVAIPLNSLALAIGSGHPHWTVDFKKRSICRRLASFDVRRAFGHIAALLSDQIFLNTSRCTTFQRSYKSGDLRGFLHFSSVLDPRRR